MPIRSLVVGTCSRETNIWHGGACDDQEGSHMPIRSLVVGTCSRETNIWRGGACDDQVVVLSADTKIKRVTHVVPVDEDGEVGVLYHGNSLARQDQTEQREADGVDDVHGVDCWL